MFKLKQITVLKDTVQADQEGSEWKIVIWSFFDRFEFVVLET